LGQLPSAERLTDWAFLRMTIKNSLTSSDAYLVEEAFRARLGAVTDSEPPAATPSTGTGVHGTPDSSGPLPSAAMTESPDYKVGSPKKKQVDQSRGVPGIDKTTLTI